MCRRAVLMSLGLLLTSTVTAGGAFAASGSLRCSAPTTSQADAPPVGSSASYTAADAGSAEVAHTEAMTLHVISTAPNPGWRGDAVYPTNRSVKVVFYDTRKRGSQVRLTVSLDNSGRHTHARVVTCT